MKLVIICQGVDAESPILGFFIEWLREFSRQCETVHAIGLEVGTYDLPKNVSVHSLGKERGSSKPDRLFRLWSLLRKLLPDSDGVYAHQAPEFVIAAWPIAAINGKPIVLWYAHKAVNARLRLAAALSRWVVTSAAAALNLDLPNAVRLGQGIPTDLFFPSDVRRQMSDVFKLLSVGRITPIKHLEIMIDAVALLRKKGLPATLTLIGRPVFDSDREYARNLKAQIDRLGLGGVVTFIDGVNYRELPDRYRDYGLHLNLAPTGAPDKAILEAMASGLPIVVANETFHAFLGPDAAAMVAAPNAASVAEKIEAVAAIKDPEMPQRMRAIVERGHSLKKLVRGIIDLYE